jgi:hypothetical protein
MDRLIKLAKLLALLSVVPVAAFLCLFLHQLTVTTLEVQTTAKNLPDKVLTKIDTVQDKLLAKIDTVQDKLTAEVNTVADKSDNRLALVQSGLVSAVNTQLAEANKNLNTQLSETNKSINTLVTAYANVPTDVAAQYNKNFDLYFNCKQNSLCLQGQASDTMFAIRDASRSTSTTMAGLSETLPKIEANIGTVSTNVAMVSGTLATSIPPITANIDSITMNIDRLTKPKWYDRILTYAVTGATIYRSLNPIGVLINSAH